MNVIPILRRLVCVHSSYLIFHTSWFGVVSCLVMNDVMFQWAEQSGCWLLEAKWYHSGYVPTTDEYLNTAWISITGPLLLFYGYLTTTNPINKQELQSLEQRPGIIHWPSMVLRLADDLGTSSVSLITSLQCTCIFSHFILYPLLHRTKSKEGMFRNQSSAS